MVRLFVNKMHHDYGPPHRDPIECLIGVVGFYD